MNRAPLLAIASLLLLATPAAGQSAETIDGWIVRLGSDDWATRNNANRELGIIGAKAVPALIDALSAHNETLRQRSATMLGKIGPEAAPAIPALIAALDDEDYLVRKNAATALGDMGTAAPVAIPALIEALQDPHSHVRHAAAHSLALQGATAAVPHLAENLSHPDLWVRHGAAEALGEMGPKAVPAIPALVDALDDEDTYFSNNAARSLGNIGDELKSKGHVLAWVVPRAYWKELSCLFLCLIGWFVAFACVKLPAGKLQWLQRLGLAAVAFTVPAAIAGVGVYDALTRDWAQGFLPDTSITQLPLPVAAVLTVAFCMMLATVWTSKLKPVEAEEAPDPA